MNISRFVKFAAVTLLTLVCVVAAEAAPWMSLGAKRQIHTLVITGNYKAPRLLAELIQDESRQPYILLPDPRDEVQKICFCPPTRNEALEIQEKNLNAFIRTCGPRRIIILGDERYVPRRYEDMLDKVIPVVRITGANWVRIAEELTFMLNLNHLDRNYKNLREKMFEDQPYRPVSRPAPKQEEKPEPKPEEKPEQPAETAPAVAPAAEEKAPAAAPVAEEKAPAAPAAK